MWTIVRNNLSFEYMLIIYVYILNLIELNIENYFLYFLFRKWLRQFWAKCPLWKHLSQELIRFCKVSLLISSLIYKILDSGIKLFSSISSKNTYLVESISKSLVAAFCFADFFWGAGSPIQEKVILFLKISQDAWNSGSSWYFPSDYTIYEGSEKLYSMLISFETCTAVPLERFLVCKAIVLICKEMFRTLFASLSSEMLVSIHKNILLRSVFLCGFCVFKYRFCAVRTMVYFLMYKI